MRTNKSAIEHWYSRSKSDCTSSSWIRCITSFEFTVPCTNMFSKLRLVLVSFDVTSKQLCFSCYYAELKIAKDLTEECSYVNRLMFAELDWRHILCHSRKCSITVSILVCQKYTKTHICALIFQIFTQGCIPNLVVKGEREGKGLG